MLTPLVGVKVLDLSRLLPGGYCSLLLSDLGADVLKVEQPGSGDYIRWLGTRYGEGKSTSDSALFVALNRGKRSLALDLKNPGGREILLRLVRDHDVLIDSFRPGALERLGLGYETLRAENPKLVYCPITGYGQTGPLSEKPGHDIDFLALSGLLSLSGTSPDRPPALPPTQTADLGGAWAATVGVLAALYGRERTGEGTLVDVSLADGAFAPLTLIAARYLHDGHLPDRGGHELSGAFVCYCIYACADGYVALGALEEKFWRVFCEGIERADLLTCQFAATGSEAHRELEAVFAGRTREQWQAFADSHDCCLAPVLGLDEALNSPYSKARQTVIEVGQPSIGGSVKQLAVPLRLDGQPAVASGPAPTLGEHTNSVLRGLGYTPAQVKQLFAERVVA